MNILSPISADQQLCLLDEEMQEHCLIRSLDEIDGNMSSPSLSGLSEASSPELTEEEEGYDGIEFLQPDVVGVVTPPRNQRHPAEIERRGSSSLAEPAKVGLPSKFDVLCGQSRICANHTGNRRFQVVLDIYAPRYNAATSKQEKMTLTKEIVGCIAAANGRFLKYKDGLWVEISNVTARDKVSHALRTKVQSWKRQQEERKSDKTTSKKTSTHRRRRTGSRRSSASSVVTTSSDIFTSSFDGNSSTTSSIMEDLLRTQREIFANLTQNDKMKNERQTHPLKKHTPIVVN